MVEIQGRRLNLQEGDEVWVEHHYCGRCDTFHSETTVTRNGKEITKLGDSITLEGEDEVFGGIVIDEKGNALPDPHWVIHILSNDESCMTEDKLHYVGICGDLVNGASDRGQNRIIFLNKNNSLDHNLLEKEKERMCPKCKEVYRSKYGKEI